MIEIQAKQLVRAMQVLDMLNCEYAIKTPDGEVFGVLKIAEPEKPKRKHKNPRKDYSLYCIPDRVGAMKVGDVEVLKPLEGDTVSQLASNVSSHGITRYGKGNFTTTTANGECQCMRLA
jgi:hypothetical protein